ncbi:MAG: DUF2357 domain-containing protein [Clostridia bacterium]|nr:DUF2357 domain-containing protein [Clostridia bacterium]
MNRLDVYYRALRNYRAQTAENRECTSFRKALAQANVENDELVITRNICTVDEEWIEVIEKGLVFIEKAIKEDRQFIYSNGEVMPIEKIKHVTKDSVQHLAKHSNLITKEQEGPDLIPDQLYSVEKLNDYAVYENRFLYMLLCYLRDFITIRYEKILEISNKYDGSLKLRKTAVLQNRRVCYTVDLHEECKDDKYLRAHNPAKASIDRIDLILKAVMSFLSTPLMEIAGKAAKLKPPITKTNVLKMDNNFKGAVALYDYIVAYDKPGYKVETSVLNLAPFSDVLAEDLSEAGSMLSFLMYEYGLGLNETLKDRYQTEEIKRKALLIEQREEQLAVLKRKLHNAEISAEEYLLETEKHMRLLQNDNRQIVPMRSRIEELLDFKSQSETVISSLKDEAKALETLMETERMQHASELAELRAAHEKRISELKQAHAETLAEAEAQMRRMDAQYGEKLNGLKDLLSENEAKTEELNQKCEALTERNRFCEARLKGRQWQSGEPFDEAAFTEKEDFDELEKELEAFMNFYDDRWDKVKKKIRKRLLNYQSLKGRTGKK